MMDTLFLCPHCGAQLKKDGGSVRCEKGHSYDYAREGYLYLLDAEQKHSLSPGDDKQMVAARAAFLEKGYYAPLRDALVSLACRYAPENTVFLDAGCGEGYYTAALHEALGRAGKAPHTLAVDISKFAVKRAAKRCKAAEAAVASVYRLPVADHSVDLLLDCFSPLAPEEFRRVLKPGGVFLYVVPGARHLYQMKEVLYDAPYENEERDEVYEGFTLLATVPVTGSISLPSQEDIAALFAMTPYAWKSPYAGKERLRALSALTTEVSFRVCVYQKL